MPSCCKYHAGMLRSLIVIERYSSVSDGMGGHTPTWTPDPAEGVWAHWEAVLDAFQFLTEKERAGRLEARPRFKAVIRFRGDAEGAPYYTEGDRVLYRGRYYSIESAVDPDDGQDWIEFALVGGAPS